VQLDTLLGPQDVSESMQFTEANQGNEGAGALLIRWLVVKWSLK